MSWPTALFVRPRSQKTNEGEHRLQRCRLLPLICCATASFASFCKQCFCKSTFGCSKTIVSRELVNNCQLRPVFRSVILMNGEEVNCSESCMCEVVVDGRCVMLDCIVSNVMPGFCVLLGMDAINRLGGVHIKDQGKTIVFGNKDADVISAMAVREKIKIDNTDFQAVFADERWKVRWKWLQFGKEPSLQNTVGQYAMEDVKEGFEKEVEEWIKQAWLRPFLGMLKESFL